MLSAKGANRMRNTILFLATSLLFSGFACGQEIILHEGESITLPECPPRSRPQFACMNTFAQNFSSSRETAPPKLGPLFETPDLPSTPLPEEEEEPSHVGFWTFGNWDVPPALRTNHQAFHDRTFLTAHAIWMASIVYDVELTHQGMAHHKCVEDDSDNPNPSRWQLYRGSIPFYAVGVFIDYLELRFVWKPSTLEIPAITSIKHFKGGSEWLTECW